MKAPKPMPRPMLVADDLHAPKDADRRGRPRSIQERFQEEMESTTRGAQKSEAKRSQGGWENWFYGQRAFPAGSIPNGAIQSALAQAVAHNGGLHGGPGDTGPPGGSESSPTWVSIGPGTIPNGQTDPAVGPLNPVSGRVSAIAVDPSNPDIVYMGGAQGGVWKTTNARTSNPIWTPLTDHQPSLAVGDIKIDPVNHNIIYVGTGEPNGSCDSYYGAGVLRSTDGGVTWKQFGSDPGGPF
ncbi:MAG TPA: hypothetical protein VKJ00_03475, partial [Thermoanaerobaculia bacterium]|nr:hypothetical protein [Thermoanaerobaculia bacterium]